jgi:hypothetical protein
MLTRRARFVLTSRGTPHDVLWRAQSAGVVLSWCRDRNMQTVSTTNFGPLIAYLVPGATALLGFFPYSETLRSWFAAAPDGTPTIGGFLYLTVASLAAGMTVSAVRWALIDSMHARTGVSSPRLHFSRLADRVEAYALLIDIHYRHYQYYANMLVALALALGGYRASLGGVWPPGWPDLAFVVLEAIFFATSRDTLRKYYARTGQLLS